ncbi:hypothetical protein KY362_03395, partial [Candidatus Woesearchaeota archaeon]|nr:hypothetical protein [Candidatus Woesearchaeota archaeon]
MYKYTIIHTMARSAQKTAAERDSTAESSTTDIDMPAATRSFLLLLAFVCFLFTIVFFPAFTGLSVVNETGNTSVNETQESTAPSYDNLNTTPENITITGDTDNTTLIQEIPENITEEIDAPEPVAANISAPDYPETPPFPPASPPPTQPEGAGGCTAPSDDLHINNDTILCEGIWSLADVNDDGLLILNASNYTLSGNGTVISGDSTGYGIL